MNEIKGMLTTLNQRNKDQRSQKILDMMAQIGQDDHSEPIGGLELGGTDDVDPSDLESWVKKQKAEIKQL